MLRCKNTHENLRRIVTCFSALLLSSVHSPPHHSYPHCFPVSSLTVPPPTPAACMSYIDSQRGTTPYPPLFVKSIPPCRNTYCPNTMRGPTLTPHPHPVSVSVFPSLNCKESCTQATTPRQNHLKLSNHLPLQP